MTLTPLALGAGIAIAAAGLLFFPTTLLARRHRDSATEAVPAPIANSGAAPNLEGTAEALLTPAGPRDDYGHVWHPALPILDEGCSLTLLLEALGFVTAIVYMEADCADEDLLDRVAEGESCLAWTPTPPTGDGWNLVLIEETEDGPLAAFIRPITPQECQARAAKHALDARDADGLRRIVSRLVASLHAVEAAAVSNAMPEVWPADQSARRAVAAIQSLRRELEHLRSEPGQRGAAA